MGVTVSGLEVGADGTVTVAGIFANGSLALGSTVFKTAPGSHWDGFVASLSPQGKFLWARQVAGTGGDLDENLSSLVVHKGSLFIGGYFRTASLTIGTTTLTNASAGAKGDVFVAGLSNLGAFRWALGGGGGEARAPGPARSKRSPNRESTLMMGAPAGGQDDDASSSREEPEATEDRHPAEPITDHDLELEDLVPARSRWWPLLAPAAPRPRHGRPPLREPAPCTSSGWWAPGWRAAR